jgi:hypothetical protein
MPIGWDKVFEYVRGCGATMCRIDWGADWETNEAILAAAERASVELLPVVFPPAPPENTEEAWYRAARAYGEECGRRYRGRITHFELSNERECRCMTKWPNGGDRDGAAMTDYAPARYAPIRGMLRGLAEGLRETHPDCVRMIDTAGWLHFGFIDLLVRDNVPFDILAWHWYSEMRSMTRPIESYSGTYVVLDKLLEYGKPVWLTEGNARNGTLANTEEEQAKYLVDTIRELRDTGQVGCYVVYELFDEPQLLSLGGEAFYGIVHCEWALSEGAEFPGARGTIGLEETDGRPALKLGWDFTRGGAYVSANWLPERSVEADELVLTVKGPPGELPMVIRFVDSTGQHLQITPTAELSGQWQSLSFAAKGPWVGKWGGANDGEVHQPLRGLWIGVEHSGPKTGELAIARAQLCRAGQVQYECDLARDPVFRPKRAWHALKELAATWD